MGAAAAAGAAAAIAQATKALGVIVKMDTEAFLALLERTDAPLVVHAEGGLFSRNYQYLTSYKGLAFFTQASQPLQLPSGTEVVVARKIWIPG